MEIIEVTESTFEEDVLKSDQLVLVDFYAEWCSPCKKQEVVLKEFAKQNPDIKVCKVNTDDCQVITKSLNIKGIPALLFYRDGKILHQRAGLNSIDSLTKMVENLKE